MRISIGLGASLFVAGVLLALFQLWLAPWSPEIFLKMEITIGAFFLIVLVVYFIVKEYGENKITRSGDRLDD